MIEACPNLNDPEVAREFNEIKDATSEKTAYNIWSLNNGYSIDKAPNGAKSILFESLLTECNGDKTAAIRAKAALYGNRFREWFGDWLQEDKTNVSKVVDENGEPLVVYHHTDNSNLAEFSTDFENYFTKDGGTKKAMFFDENKTGTLGRKYDIPVFLNIKDLNEYNETKQQLHDRGTTYRDVVNQSAAKNNRDGGVHMKDFDDNKMEHQSIWIVHNSNQIKSATGNIEIKKPGTGFSTTDNNIYKMLGLYEADVNPYKVRKNLKYIVLSEETSESFENYINKSRGNLPKQFYDNYHKVMYVKSNNRKNSRKYDIINSETGEIIAYGKIILTRSLYNSLIKTQNEINEKFTNYNIGKSLSFKKRISTPSKSLFKQMAKLFLIEAVRATSDAYETSINHEVIDEFVDQFDDSVWEHIITYTLNPSGKESYDSGTFGMATTSFDEVFGHFSFNRTIPKLGLIDEAQKRLGLDIEKYRFTGYVHGEYYKNLKISRALPYNVLEEMLRRYARESHPISEYESIQEYAKEYGYSIERLNDKIKRLREDDTIESSKILHSIIEYNPSERIIDKILREYNEAFKKYLTDKGIHIPTNIVNIVFNRDSFAGDDTPLIRLATIMHEPFHALLILHQSSKENIKVWEAFDKFIHTEYGKQVYEEYKNANRSYNENHISSEFLADLFSFIMMPKLLRREYASLDQPFLGITLAKTISSVLDRPNFKTVILASPKMEVELFTKEEKIVLPLIKRIFNAIVLWLSKYSDFVKNTIKLYKESLIVTEYKRNDTFETREDFLEDEQLEEFKKALNYLSETMLLLAKQEVKTKSIKEVPSAFYMQQQQTQSYDDAVLESLSHMPVVQVTLDSLRENWIRSQNPQTDEERANLAREFDLKQLRDNTNNVVNKIASEYNLEHNGTEYISRDNRGKYVAMLVNSIQKRLSDPKFAPIEAAFLNCTILGTDDISSYILLMAKVYIEDFYQADAILEVMKIIDPKGTMHKDDLENHLVDLVVKTIIDPNSNKRSIVSKINNNIANFVRKYFNHNTISNGAKLILIDTIAKNMSCCEDLERTNTEDLLHDVKWYEITGKESQVTPKDVINQIKKGIKIQIKSLRSVTNVDEDKVLILNQLLEKLDDIDLKNNPDDVLGVVSEFIAQANSDINQANADLRNMLNGDPINIDDGRLYLIKTDVIGYYRSIIKNYIIPFTRNATNPTLQPGGALYGIVRDMLNKCTNTLHLYDYVLSQHIEAMISKFVDSNVNIGDKKRFKVNCILWLNNKINNGDLGFFENWVKSAASSHSQIVRMVDAFVRDNDTQVRQQALARSKKLLDIYKNCESTISKLSPFNYQRLFCELDDDGQTTGNFLTAVNVGQFEKEKRLFIDKWINERGVQMDDDGTLIFPDDQTWKDYNDAYDDFLEGRQHRRYTANYYKLERQYMSRDTIEYKRNIRHRIQMLYDKCFDKEVGAPNIWKLDRADRQGLQDLLKLQQNLSNPFIIEYDSNGKISKITEKTGDLLRMAEEIGAFNKAIAGKIKFSPNYDKYNSAKEAMKNKFGENSMEYKQFVWNFSTRQATPLYYARLREIFGAKSQPLVDDIQKIDQKINAITNATISKKGKYVQDLSKMSDEAYAKLKELELKKSELLESALKRSGKKLTEKEKAELASMHHYEYVKNPQTGREYIKELEEQYMSAGKRKEYLDKFFVLTGEKVRPLSIFSVDVISPEYIDEETPIGMFSDVDLMSDFVDPKYDPNDDEFMNIDKERYHNAKYDEMIKDKNAKRFYDEMLAMMEEAWSMLPDINRHYKYMLPQRRGNISLLVARDVINAFTGREGRQKSSIGQVAKNVVKLTALGAIGGLALGGMLALLPSSWIAASTAMISSATYGTISGFVGGLLTRDKNIAERLLSVTENDIEFNETYAIRPDGSEVETIPIRFVKRLDDPTAVSTSLIHSVSSFYEMALNYSQKEKLAPIVENIQFMLSGGFSGSTTTDQAERVRSYKSAMIYGRKKTGIARRSSNKMTDSEQKITKLVQFVLNTTHAKMLPWNATSMFKNAIDSVLSFIVNVASGKYITWSDIGWGILDMGKEIVNGTAFTNIGSADTKSFTGAAMQYNGVHMGLAETFDDTEMQTWRRIVKRFSSMGPFTFIDYTFKGLFLNSVYNTYRLVLNPSTGKEEFMNKQEAQFAYADSLGRKAGLEIWKKSKTKLKNAYIVTDEGLKLKPEFENIVRPIIDGKPSYRLEMRVSGLIKEQTAVINGMLDSQDINKISQNFIGGAILLMRGWMVALLTDYNKDGQDFAVFASNTEEISKIAKASTVGSLQSKIIGNLDAFVIQSAPSELEGLYNLATGFIERGWWVGWIKCIKNMLKGMRYLTRHNKYQLKALATILITTVSLGLLTHPLYDWKESADTEYGKADPYNFERVASNFLYTGTVAAYSERFGQLGPVGFMNSFLELVNSPTVASSWVKDLNTITDACEDMITLLDAMYNNESVDQTEPMQIVKRGSFKEHKKITRDLLKASSELPGINALGISNIYKSISPDAQKEKLKFYKETIPFAGAQPWLKLPDKNNKPSTTSNKIKPIKRNWK